MPPFAFRRGRSSKSNLTNNDVLDTSFKTDRYANVFELPPHESDITEGVESGKMKKCALSMLEMSEIGMMREFGAMIDSMEGDAAGGRGEPIAVNEDDFLLIDDSERSDDVGGVSAESDSSMGGFFRYFAPSSGGMRRSTSMVSFGSGEHDLCLSSMMGPTLPEIDEKEEEEVRPLQISMEKEIESGVGEELVVGVNFNDNGDAPRIKSHTKSSSTLLELDQSQTNTGLRSSLKRQDSNASFTSTNSNNNGLRSSLKRRDSANDLDMSSTSVNSTKPMKRNVSFTSLEIRSYNITLGDAPTLNGPPISLDWDHSAPETHRIDAYEEARTDHRRSKHEMLMPPSHRRYLLMREAGFTRGEIQKAVEEAKRVAENRRRTRKNVKLQPVEEILESGKRKFGRLMNRRGSKEL